MMANVVTQSQQRTSTYSWTITTTTCYKKLLAFSFRKYQLYTHISNV